LICLQDVYENFLFGKSLDHGLFLEKLWLLIFNYKKNNKNYIDLDVKDYLTFDKDLIIKNNTIKFEMFIIFCQIYIEIQIDSELYFLYISRPRIYLKNKDKTLYKYDPRLNNLIQNAIKDMSNVSVVIKLDNNMFEVTTNNILLFKYKLERKNKINSGKILTLSKDNKFIDL
jgi:hypothetical protein